MFQSLWEEHTKEHLAKAREELKALVLSNAMAVASFCGKKKIWKTFENMQFYARLSLQV